MGDSAGRASRRVAIRLIPATAWLVLAVLLNAVAFTAARPPSLPLSLPSPDRDSTALEALHSAFPGTGTDNTAALVVSSGRVATQEDVHEYLAAVSRSLSSTPVVQAAPNMAADPLTAPATQDGGRHSTALPLWLAGELGSPRGLQSLTDAQTAAARVPRPNGLTLSWTGPAVDAQAQQHDSSHATTWTIGVLVIAAVALALLMARPVRAAVAATLSTLLALMVVVPLHSMLVVEQSDSPPMSLMVALTGGVAFGAIQMLLSTNRGVPSAPRQPRRFGLTLAPALGATAAAAITLITLGAAASPHINAAAVWAGISIAVGAAVVLTTAPLYLGSLRRERFARRPSSALAALKLRKQIYRYPQRASAIATVTLIVAGCGLVGAQPTVTTRFSPNSAAAQGLWAGPTPESVLITAGRNLRTPAGLVALDRVTRQLIAVPGVRGVQSPSWPGGQPWPDATVAHYLGALNRQVQASGLAASPTTTAVTGIPDLVGQMATSVDRLQQVVNASTGQLSSANGSVDRIHSSIAALTHTIERLSARADPLRRWVSSFPDCSADALCSLGDQLIDPMDTVVADTTRLTASSGEISRTATDTASILASSRAAITQLQASLTEMEALISGASTAVSDSLPEMARSTAFLNVMSDDLSAGDGGGFYLSQAHIDGERYTYVRNTLFTPDGKSARLFVFTDPAVARPNGGSLADDLSAAIATATKFGPLHAARVDIIGVHADAAHAEQQWPGRVRWAAALALLAAVLIVGVSLRSIRAGAAVALVTTISAVGGQGLYAILCTLLLGLPVAWPVVALGGAIGLGVVVYDTAGASTHVLMRQRRDRPHLGFRSGGTALAVATLMWAAAAATTDAATWGQVGIVAALTTVVGYGLVRTGMLWVMAADRNRRLNAPHAVLAGGQLRPVGG